MEVQQIVLINAVGMTSRLLSLAPRLGELARAGWSRPLEEVVPAVTCSAQATLLTGKPPEEHGIVGNGWLFRETGEIRFWQQSHNLLQAEPVYSTARRLARELGRPFRVAKLFWWFNQGAAVDFSVTPKPYYGADGNKAFGIAGTPEGLTGRLERELGKFPFPTFWGPAQGCPAHTGFPARQPMSSIESGPSSRSCTCPILITTPSDLARAAAIWRVWSLSSTRHVLLCSILPGPPGRASGW